MAFGPLYTDFHTFHCNKISSDCTTLNRLSTSPFPAELVVVLLFSQFFNSSHFNFVYNRAAKQVFKLPLQPRLHKNGTTFYFSNSYSVFLSSRIFVKSRWLWVHQLDIFRLMKQGKQPAKPGIEASELCQQLALIQNPNFV